jgi:integrase
MSRHHNDHLRKVCGCPRRRWAKCDHPWHFNFKPAAGPVYRFSLERELGEPVRSKTEAEAARDRVLVAIRAGTFRKRGSEPPAPDAKAMTVRDLLAEYQRRVVSSRSESAQAVYAYALDVIAGTVVEGPVGAPRALGGWRLSDVTTDTIERFKDARQGKGRIATNRHLSLLQAVCSWGSSRRRGYLTESPFRDGDRPAIERFEEHARTRRLQPGEDRALFAACGPDLRALVEAAIETGMRQGELLSLQWQQVGPTAIVLPASKTKTRRDRRIPISPRLLALLDMRRHGPDNEPHPGTAYVFGTATGERIASVRRAWHSAVLRAHGHTPTYVKRTNLSPASRAALKAINLHFHDLRREAGSRWLDRGVPLHAVQALLGHANVAQTSTYLAVTNQGLDDVMARAWKRETLEPVANPLQTDSIIGVGDGYRTRDLLSHSQAFCH